MTKEEAIKELKELEYYGRFFDNSETEDKKNKALFMAIEAIEQEPCEDAISRNAALDCLTAKRLKQFDFILQARKEIMMLPSVSTEKTGRWIPVSESGYPKPEDEYKRFLTIDNKGEITIQEFLLSLDEEPQPYFTGWGNIVAYMPLPEVYKEK